MRTRDLMWMNWGKSDNTGGGSGGGASAEIPTCTVEFVIGESAYYTGNYAYTKYENGVISTISVEYEDYQYEGEKFTFDNVVCGSIIHFDWSYDWENVSAGDIWVNGNASLIQTADVTLNETCTFSAQLEPNSKSTITVTGIWIDDSGGWEE